VDQHGPCCHVDVEVVIAGDGQVPHPAGGIGGSVTAEDADFSAAAGAQEIAGGQGVGVCPAAGGLVPEPVMAGGLDDRGPAVDLDRQVIQVVVVLEDDGLDGLGLRLARFRIRGEHFVAGFQLADQDRGPGGEQDLRGRREAVITARVDRVPVGGVGAGVFCGKAQESDSPLRSLAPFHLMRVVRSRSSRSSRWSQASSSVWKNCSPLRSPRSQ
jgi:hypothetical protein